MAKLFASKEGWKVILDRFLRFFLITLLPMILIMISGAVADEFPAGWAFAGIIVTDLLLALAKGFKEVDPEKLDDFEWILNILFDAIIEFIKKYLSKQTAVTPA